MTGPSSGHDGRDIDGDCHRRRQRDRRSRSTDTPSRPVESDLEAVVVRYEDGPDRRTITPRECDDAERLTTWLSANADAFVELGAVR
ncbi:hypothetical protein CHINAEXTREME_18015 [Halobiforma lacisalsi AJ5]|uniref:DUF7511 domain-containing protein n=1 Tax=Natronobacterium lacisalsi AJ5 TaxID=358396 RepID=M0LI55_NATLA|nr:hypothetical protein [Halobiforma lacisalsi]APW99549.1 hypothetical protein CHINAEXTREME_18015 [Halobiforma lacisalsi AJ5]EMA31675.1 hypothetical protein C445_14372 [Halobiforma lacisalsi AJ5]